MLHYASHPRFDFSASSVEASIASWLLMSMAPVKNNVTPNVSARLTNAPHVCVSAHLHNFKTKISFSCYAMPAHLITKRVGGVRVSLKGRQLSVEAVLPRGVELTALLGQRSTEEFFGKSY